MKKYLLILCAAMTLAGCGADNAVPTDTARQTSDTSRAETTAETTAEETTTTRSPLDEGLYAEPEPIDDEEQPTAILSSAEDIGLHDTDGSGTNYAFTYDGEEYSAVYTPDNWKIIDSYKITNIDDMTIICQALSDVYPIHGSDMQSWRTPEDMAYEWDQHNLAYAILPEDNEWRIHAKDVDINPEDQGKNIYEIYKDRTGSDMF